MEKSFICFLDTSMFDEGAAIRGAALLTDSMTEPVEFRCTSPVHPTQLQRTLWGDRLIAHIATHLVGKPLLDALGASPSLVIVRKPEFVELRALIEIPLVQLLRKDELAMASPFAFPDGEGEPLTNGDTNLPLIIKAHRQFQGDIQTARNLLGGDSSLTSLLDPFDRIANSLTIVHQQEAGKGQR